MMKAVGRVIQSTVLKKEKKSSADDTLIKSARSPTKDDRRVVRSHCKRLGAKKFTLIVSARSYMRTFTTVQLRSRVRRHVDAVRLRVRLVSHLSIRSARFHAPENRHGGLELMIWSSLITPLYIMRRISPVGSC